MRTFEMKKQVEQFRAATAEWARTHSRLSMKAKEDASGEMYLYDVINSDDGWGGGVTPKGVVSGLEELKKAGCNTLDIYLNSPGGDVFAAVAIFNAISRFSGKKNVHVDGLAASSASLIAMCGDKITMAKNAMMMIHNPWGFAMGESSDMRKAAEVLDQVKEVIVNTYCDRTGCSSDQARKWMDEETWMNAEEAVTRQFADEVSGDEDEEASDGDEPTKNTLNGKAGKESLAQAKLALEEMNTRLKNKRSVPKGQPFGKRNGQP